LGHASLSFLFASCSRNSIKLIWFSSCLLYIFCVSLTAFSLFVLESFALVVLKPVGEKGAFEAGSFLSGDEAAPGTGNSSMEATE
jgi:hypothetical protein